jgi:ubiquinone biosynthesis protein UbiJ
MSVADTPARIANRILEQESWAREKLRAFAGRVFTLSVGPLTSCLCVSETGLLEAARKSTPTDLTLRLSPLAVPAFLAHPERWNQYVREEGDADLAGVLKDLAKTLPWFVEQAFARALGPLLGQRAAETGRKLLAFPEYAGQRVSESMASYARDEAGLLVRSDELRGFAGRVAAVADATQDLSARVDALHATALNVAAPSAGMAPARVTP